MKYVQPFSEGLSRLLENSAGKYGPTLAISHFLPLYIPSLHNSDFGGSFTELFNKDFNIATSGIACEPIWLPSKTIRYEYVATPQNKISSIVNVSNIPYSASVSTSSTNAVWENACIQGGKRYTLSKVSGGLTGVDGWFFDNVQSFYDYSVKLSIDNLFPIKDYEAFTGDDNTVCGRYIVGFKDIANKIGIDKNSAQFDNIYNSKFIYNAVVLYGFKIDNVIENSNGVISYKFLETPYPVAIAGIEGQPIALNMDSMNNTGSEWDSVWNIDINFIPFDAGSGISNVTHRIVSENSYWTKNNSTTIHTNNKMHVGLTVEPYGNTDNDSKHSAWLHISNKNIDPGQFNPASIDRRHIRLDSTNTFTTIEHKDTVNDNGVIEIKTYNIDNYQTGLNVDLDSSPFVQVHGASAYGEQDIAVGPGVKHVGSNRAISVGTNIIVSGNIDNVLSIGTDLKSLNSSSDKLGNIINVGKSTSTYGKNFIKVGNDNSTSVAVSAVDVINIGDDNSSFDSLKNSIIVGNSNFFDNNFNDANHTVGTGLLIIGDGNALSTKDGSTETTIDNGTIKGNRNRLTSIEKSVSNFDIEGTDISIDNSDSDLSNVVVIGDDISITAIDSGNLNICGSGIDVNVGKSVKVFGNDIVLNSASFTKIFGNNFTSYGTTLNVVSCGNNNSIGKTIWSKTTLDDSTARKGINILVLGDNINSAGGQNVLHIGSTISGGDNRECVFVGNSIRYNSSRSSLVAGVEVSVDCIRNSVTFGNKITSYGMNTFQKSGLTYLSNSVAIGDTLDIAASNQAKADQGIYYSGNNIVAVGKNLTLRDSVNGVFVGSDLLNYGGQGMAIGNNITLHAGSSLSFGKIYALGSNISYGRSGGTVPLHSGPSSVFVFGESFSSNDYISSTSFDSYTNYITMPIAYFANNAYGNNSFKTVTSNSNYSIKIGKFVQSTNIYNNSTSPVCDGAVNWKCPWGGYTGLSNSADIRINLPVLEQRYVFGNPDTKYDEHGVRYFTGSETFFDNMLFVDENGYVRQSTQYHRDNYTVDIASTVMNATTSGYYESSDDMRFFANCLNSIIYYFNQDQSTKNSNHVHTNLYNKNYIYHIMEKYLNTISIVGTKKSSLKMAIINMNAILNTAFNNTVLSTSTHTASNHPLHLYSGISLETLDPGVAGTHWNYLVGTYRALVYYINNSIIIGTDGKHKHLPCTITIIPFGSMGG